jgi:ATP-dependent Lon protease
MLRAVETAMNKGKTAFAVSQRENVEEFTIEGLYTFGVVVALQRIEHDHGGATVRVQGHQRANVIHYHSEDEVVFAEVNPLEVYSPIDIEDLAFAALHKELRERTMELGKQRGVPDEVVKKYLSLVISPSSFVDLVASHLDLPVAERQGLLETLSVEERMQRMLVHVQRQVDILKVQAEIRSQVKEKIGIHQRAAFLREQLKAIQKELGEDDSGGGEIRLLRDKLDKLDLPDDTREEVARELDRLKRVDSSNSEAQVIRTYLDWITQLPWNEYSEDNLDQKRASEVLEEDHYGLTEVKDRVLEFLAVCQLRAKQNAHKSGDAKARAMARGPILLFIGPPGVGKSSIAKSIARAIDRRITRIALGGVQDESDIRGHRRTYVGAMSGCILQGLKQAGTKNPVILLDEIDKLSNSVHGNPLSALLEVLDPVQNSSFTDHYLNLPFDLNEVIFIATANYAQNVPSPLLDRMEVVEFSGYTEAEKMEIAKGYLIPRQLEENALVGQSIRFSDEALKSIIRQYTRESGVRHLSRRLDAIARKMARILANDDEIEELITPQLVRQLIGRPHIHPEQANTSDEVGVATGMYFSPFGGDIMFVETSIRRLADRPDKADEVSTTAFKSRVNLILTGQLGDVMQESARTALTYATAQTERYQITRQDIGSMEVHVHVPAGAIPKDGPSAGVAIAVSILSALSWRPVRRDVAMTGELTLRGRILPIGGIKEKLLGAHRADIRHIIIPRRNEADLEDLPKDVRDELTVYCVNTVDEALCIALSA